MDNDEDLLAFNTWREERVQYVHHVVVAVNDHTCRTVTLRWAGDGGEALNQLRAEARRRGITVVVQSARYTRKQLQEAAQAVFGAETELAEVGFSLSAVSTGAIREGLVVLGADASKPATDNNEPLSADLISRVLALLGDLQGVGEVFSAGDIRVEHGWVVPC